jgi:hypothetical protein
MAKVLLDDQLASFRRDGFVRLEAAFPRDTAQRCRDLLWDQLPEARDDPSTWKRPVARIGVQSDPAFSTAATSPRWVQAIHDVAGPDAAPTPWLGGTFAIRFPVDADPGDDGWHIDGSYVGPDGAFWVNHRSDDRALLMLALFSDVGHDDAPTRIRVGSHLDIPDALLPYGDPGVSAMTFGLPAGVHERPLALATGRAGDVYLCHPFLVHAAQRHHGREPRFLAQPGVPWTTTPFGTPRDGVRALSDGRAPASGRRPSHPE